MKTPYIWKDGKLINWDDCLEHVVNHSLHYGSGVFEGIRFYPTSNGPKVFRLKDHIKRLFYSASVMNLKIDFGVDDIVEACKLVVSKSGIESGYIRPIIYHSFGPMGLKAENKSSIAISVWQWGKYLSENPVKAKIPSIKRLAPQTADMNAKVCGYYVNSILASMEVRKLGYDEGVLLDIEGNIAEGPGENIFFVKGNQVYTPAKGSILPGITRDTIIQILKNDFGITTKEEKIKPNQLGDFDEAFFTGTAAEITLIGSITDENGKTYNYSHNLSNKIKVFYDDLVRGKKPFYNDWLY